MLDIVEVAKYDDVKIAVNTFASLIFFIAFVLQLIANNDGYVSEHYKVLVETEYYVLDTHFMITEIYHKQKRK